MLESVKGALKAAYVVFAFCSVFFVGALKGIIVGSFAGLLLIVGNISVILGLFPVHVAWTVNCLVKTPRFDAALKAALLFALFPLFAIWLSLGIAGSILVGAGYGFFTPWVSAFEAFRQERESEKFLHCIVDGTWQTVKGSCTVVRDFTDFCYYSYRHYLKELHEASSSDGTHTVRFIEVPGIIFVGLLGLAVEIPIYTAIALLKSPFMLFKGWQRLLHDLISREGPFLETACIPVAGLAIVLWPVVVVGSVLLAIFSSFFVGLYGSVVVYQERSFWRGIAYVIAMVSEFDEYTNDWLYLRDGSVLPKPQYRKKKASRSLERSVMATTSEPPAMLVPNIGPSRSLREAIQEVKMVQIWEYIMKSCEMKGKVLIDAKIIRFSDLQGWFKDGSGGTIIGVGIPCYTLLTSLINSIKAGSMGILLTDGVEVNHLNRPQDHFLDWFFHPVLILKEQIKVIKMSEGELRFLEKLILGTHHQRMQSWDNGSIIPHDTLRHAQIQAISRRLMGITRSIAKLPTYRRRFRQVVKILIAYCPDTECSNGSTISNSVVSIDLG